MSILKPDDLADLRRAHNLLQAPSLTSKFQSVIGRPIQEGIRWLPEKWRDRVNGSAEVALKRALDFSITSLGSDTHGGGGSKNFMHKMMVAASGAAGGALGLPALAVELPVSTVIMLRSIADIARSEGEDVREMQTRLACLEVFALGGHGQEDDFAETGYYAVRAVMAQQVADALRHLAQGGTARAAASPVARLVSSIAGRFGIVVGEKAMAMAVPIIGAAGGALVNTLFINHFQDMARGHFIVRRLERSYGKDTIKLAYDAMSAAEASSE